MKDLNEVLLDLQIQEYEAIEKNNTDQLKSIRERIIITKILLK